MDRFRLSAVVLLLLCGAGLARTQETFQAKCIGISDGDTITVLKDHSPVKIRIEGIDCPELHQDFGNRARQFTFSLVFGQVVTVSSRYFDRYGRLVARVSLGGKDLSLVLVQAGLAWRYRAHSSDKALEAAERQARAARRGLWSMKNPVPPWQWRKDGSHTKAPRR